MLLTTSEYKEFIQLVRKNVKLILNKEVVKEKKEIKTTSHYKVDNRILFARNNNDIDFFNCGYIPNLHHEYKMEDIDYDNAESLESDAFNLEFYQNMEDMVIQKILVFINGDGTFFSEFKNNDYDDDY